MAHASRAGRPPAITLDMLEEAACELFFEQGYAQTSVAAIAQRAGVSRATFFNYVAGKDDLLWVTVDEAFDELSDSLGRGAADGDIGVVRSALTAMADRIEPCTVVLALANADLMGLADALAVSSAMRQQRLAAALAAALEGGSLSPLASDVLASAYAGAFLVALKTWSLGTPARRELGEYVAQAFAALDVVGDGAGNTELPDSDQP